MDAQSDGKHRSYGKEGASPHEAMLAIAVLRFQKRASDVSNFGIAPGC